MNEKYLKSSRWFWAFITLMTLIYALYEISVYGWSEWPYFVMVGLAAFMSLTRFWFYARAKKQNKKV